MYKTGSWSTGDLNIVHMETASAPSVDPVYTVSRPYTRYFKIQAYVTHILTTVFYFAFRLSVY